MSEAYSDYAPMAAQVGATSIPAKMRVILDARIRKGVEGIDLNAGYDGGKRKRAEKDIVFRNFVMNERVFDLGCKIAERQLLSLHMWVNWMTDAEITTEPDEVKILHRNRFFCEYANAKLGRVLSSYFNLPVTFISDNRIEQRVA